MTTTTKQTEPTTSQLQALRSEAGAGRAIAAARAASTARLMDSDTASDLGPATPEQERASYATGTDEGHIMIDADTGEVVPESLESLYRDQRGATLRRVYVQR